MALVIIKPGILDSVQDGGRYGHASAGINPGGVMDAYAAATANFLVGNAADEPVLEMHFPAAQILFNEDALISVCGADFSPAIHDENIPNWQPVMVKRNGTLHFQKWRWGSRVYVAIHGGFKLNKWLNSYSTNLKAAAGGYKGRPLMKDDVLEVNARRLDLCKLVPAKQYCHALPWGHDPFPVYEDPDEIYIVRGPEWLLLNEQSRDLLTGTDFIIEAKSDRMGYLLRSEPLQLQQPLELISSGVDFGTVQLLPNGQLMILMADHQTTGGYPRIANVIGRDLHKLSQLRPGNMFMFQMTYIRSAEQVLFSQQHDLRIIERACLDHLNQLYA